MRSRYKKKSAIGLGIGLPLILGGFVVVFGFSRVSSLVYTGALAVLAGTPFYLWGCCALAKAKGYSTAIVWTALCGLLFPIVVLLALPDKHKHYRGQN